MTRHIANTDENERRRFLKALGLTGAVAVTSQFALDELRREVETEPDSEFAAYDGETGERVSDPANRPNLVITEEYPGGKAVVRPDYLSKRGVTETVTFTATDAVSACFAQNYRRTKGKINVS